MIEDIVKLRRKGLSFRKIADKLDSTVGKVQYQWVKHVKKPSEDQQNLKKGSINTKLDGHVSIRKQVPKDGLMAWLINHHSLVTFWRVSEQKKKLVHFYFEKPYASFLKALRVYDVTDIIFNGKNAHSTQEIILADNTDNWTLIGLRPSRCYCIELGIKVNEQKFFPLLRSNVVQVPRSSREQTGQLKHEISNFAKNTTSPPNWVEHVSTYSYYEKVDHGRDLND